MRTPLRLLVPVAALALSGCSAATSEPAPTVTETVTETVEVAAAMPMECAEAFEAVEALLQQSSQLSDDWQQYASVTMVELLQGQVAETVVVAEHQAMVTAQTAFADAVTASEYAELRAACLAGDR